MLDLNEDFVPEVESGSPSSDSLWVDKYRPSKLEDICLAPELKKIFEEHISNKDIPNMTLIGPPGVGKTTLAMALCNEISANVLFVSCASGEGRIDTISSKIVPFCQYFSPTYKKVVILDELDSASATQANSFQKALRNVIERFPDCRFVATANYKENILPAVLSRMPEMVISFDTKAMLSRMGEILVKEKVVLTQISGDELRESLKALIHQTYPDIRSLFGKLQMACAGGVLTKASLLGVCKGSTEHELLYAEFYKKVLGIIKSYAFTDVQSLRYNLRTSIIDAMNNGRDPDGKLNVAYEFVKGLFEYVLSANPSPLGESGYIDTLIKLTEQLHVIEIALDKDPQVLRFLLILARGLVSAT